MHTTDGISAGSAVTDSLDGGDIGVDDCAIGGDVGAVDGEGNDVTVSVTLSAA